MAALYRLDDAIVHYEWNNALPPQLTIDPGDTVVFRTRDAADRFYSRASTSEDVLRRGPFKGHPLAGPVHVRGAAPGDALIVDVVAMRPTLDFGWTAVRPGRGLLPEADFPKPYLQIWDLSDGQYARCPGVAVPLAPFPGVMGTALEEPGGHSTMPPRKNGGNMDIKQLGVGSTVALPVGVDGALFSVGDGHGAQGDGEVCVTAVEMCAEITLRFDLARDRRLPEPRFRVHGALPGATDPGPWVATTAHGPDLFAAAQQAVRYMIEHLVHERGLSREAAYVICSVAADLKISEIVDAPNWIVSAFLSESIFV